MRRLVLAVMLWIGACTTLPQPPVAAAPPPSPRPIRLTLVGTNDLHGWAQPHTARRADGRRVEEGGLAAFSGYLAILRADNPGGVLLLDGGDLFQGTLASNLTEGSVVVEAYNHLGYTAVAVGNHEFDYGPVGPQPIPLDPSQDPFGALKARIRQARFPFLASNLSLASGGGRPAWLGDQETVLVEVQGIKVGILGLITPHTRATTNPVNVATLEFGALAESATAAAARLRAAGAEVVVAVMHAGGKCKSLADPRDVSSCDPNDGELFGMMRQLAPGTLDAVVAGHTHQPLGHFVEGVPVIESAGLGRSFGVIELRIDPLTRRPLPEATTIQAAIPICLEVDPNQSCSLRALQEAKTLQLVPATFLGQPVVKDAVLEAALAPALARVEVEQQRPLGVVAAQRLGRNYEAESVLGSLLADSLREMEGAQVVLLNPGGLRADLKEGPLTFGDVYELLPFDNTVATATVTGAELEALLQAAYSGRKGLFQVSGLEVTLRQCGGRARLQGFRLANGRPVDPAASYRLVVPDYLARGTEGVGAVLSRLPEGHLDLGEARPQNLREALISHWQKRRPVLSAPPLGRIRLVPGGAQCPGSSSGPATGRD